MGTLVETRPTVVLASCANCGMTWRQEAPCVCPLCGYRHSEGEFASLEKPESFADGLDTAHGP